MITPIFSGWHGSQHPPALVTLTNLVLVSSTSNGDPYPLVADMEVAIFRFRDPRHLVHSSPVSGG